MQFFLPLNKQKSMSVIPTPLLVSATCVALVVALPLAYLFIRSLGAPEEAWASIFRLRTMHTLWRTVQLVFTVTLFSILLSLPIAWLTVRTDLPLRRLWVVATSLPLVIPSYVGAFLIVSFLGPKGLLQNILSGPFGVDRLPEIYGLFGATFTLSLLSYPYVLLTVRGALMGIDPSLEESARTLGLGRLAVIFKVTIPLLRPSILAGSLLVALYTVSDFGAVSLLNYETLTRSIYLSYTALDRNGAALLSLFLAGFAFLILLTEAKFRGKKLYYRTGAGTARLSTVVRLGYWKWPALIFCSLVVAVALIIPLSILAYWLVRGVLVGETFVVLWDPIRNSIFVSMLACVATVFCAMPVAALSARYPGFLSRVVEKISFTGFALPGIVVALSIVFFGIGWARPIYQTVWLLVFAYVILFLPAALGSIRASFLQLSPKQEEASRGLGKNSLQTMISITIPQLRSGVVAGAVLVFLVTLKELPATLLLAPLEFGTLATKIWTASEEAFFAQAALPAIILIIISCVPMVFLIFKDSRTRN